MGNTQTSGNDNNESNTSGGVSTDDVYDYDVRWKRFIDSLDVSAEHIKQIESLQPYKKKELLLNYESKNLLCPTLHYVTFLKSFRIDHLLKKKIDGSTLRTFLSSLDISLRTNSVERMYEFLDSDGLETLGEFMFQCLHFLSSQNDVQNPSKKSNVASKSQGDWCGPYYDLYCTAEKFEYFCTKDKTGNVSNNLMENSAAFNYLPHLNGPMRCCSAICDLLRDCIHLSLRCFRTVLNNQKGCKAAMDHPHMISLLAFCLLHPNYSTKALILDILTALCLIEGGHVKVLQAFDRLRVVMGEGLRFELLLTAFRHHEILDDNKYNLEFAVTCVQFLNIVVHSPENINLRVYLQYEMHLLGLDDLLKKIRDQVNYRLRVQIDAYLDNRVDCSLLLEDAKAKESAVIEQTRLRRELHNEIIAKNQMESNFKSKQAEFTTLIESLNKHVHQLDAIGADKQLVLQKQIDELQLLLNETQAENTRLQENLLSVKSSTPVLTDILHKQQQSPIQISKSISTSTHFDTFNLSKNNKSVNRVGSVDSRKFVMNTTNQIRMSPSGSEASLCNDHPHQCVDDEAQIDKSDERPEKPPRKCPNQSQCGWLPNLESSRTLATHATALLTALVNAVTNAIHEVARQNANAFITTIHPIGWSFSYPVHSIAITNTTATVNNNNNNSEMNNEHMKNLYYQTAEETIFNGSIFHKCLILNALNRKSVTSGDYENFHTLHSYLNAHCEHFNEEPWLTVMNKCKSYFDPNSENDQIARILPTVNWLQQIGLLAQTVQPQDCLTTKLKESKLFQQLINLQLNAFCAQYLLCECCSLATVDQVNQQDYSLLLFVQLEKLLVQHLVLNKTDCSIDFNYSYSKYQHPVLISFLQANLMKHTFLVELQYLIENLSTLLEGCSALLVNHKLPLILQFVWHFTASVLGDFKSIGFPLKCLDSLVNWHIPVLSTTADSRNPTSNSDDTKLSKSANNGDVKCKFMPTFVKFVANIGPNLLDWFNELDLVENATKISLFDIYARLERMQMGLKVWRYCVDNLNSKLLLPIDESNHLLELLTKTIGTVTMTVHSTAIWLQAVSPTSTQCPPSDSIVLRSDWLSPLIRFATSFKTYTNDVKRKRSKKCDSLDSNSHSANNSSGRQHYHRRHRHHHHQNSNSNKEEHKLQPELEEKPLRNKNKSVVQNKHSQEQRRTRQLDADGVMDDILHNLTLNPLRADLHAK